jgi:phosphoribosylanthranilate isomerase
VTHVKVCGVTSVEDARMCALAGASSIGINLWPKSPRHVEEAAALEIARAVTEAGALAVGVVVDRSVEEMVSLRERLGLGCLQLHGDEPPDALSPLLPHAYKAIRVATADDVARADAYPGDYLLVDAKVPGAIGGSGRTFDWSLVAGLARRRKLTLAGGLTAENVAEAIRVVSPYCVDVASGVEVAGAPRRKDPARVAAFVAAVRGAER